MRARRETLERGWYLASLEEVGNEYASHGYVIEREGLLGDFRFDLIARKGEELVVVELKTGALSPHERENVVSKRNYVVHELAGKFRMVLAPVPEGPLIQIHNLEGLLFEFILENVDSTGLQGLASHVQVEEVVDVELEAIEIESDTVKVKGEGIVGVTLQYGSGSDEVELPDSYPFTFAVEWDGKLKIREGAIDVDVSSFYD